MADFHFPKSKLHQQKIMATVWWSAFGVIHYSFLENNHSITADIYCNQIADMHTCLKERRPALVNRRGPILFHDNARPHVARMTLQKLTDMGYETLPHSPYSQIFHLLIIIFLSTLSTFFNGTIFALKKRKQLSSQPITFYQRGINNFVDRWQRCIAAQGSYFDKFGHFYF